MTEVAFTVAGTARPAGSKDPGINRRTGKLFVRDSSGKAGAAWRADVAWAARAAMRDRAPLEGALRMTLTFTRVRPKGHWGVGGLNKTGRTTPAPITRPDVLKLARAVEDSLSGVCYRDDSQIVHEHLVKAWGLRDECRVEIARVDFVGCHT